MKQNITREIEIPEGVEVKIDGRMLSVKGSEGELSREFEMEGFKFEVKDKKIIIGYDKATKREK
jgi:large subunit ribosomal protein L6